MFKFVKKRISPFTSGSRHQIYTIERVDGRAPELELYPFSEINDDAEMTRIVTLIGQRATACEELKYFLPGVANRYGELSSGKIAFNAASRRPDMQAWIIQNIGPHSDKSQPTDAHVYGIATMHANQRVRISGCAVINFVQAAYWSQGLDESSQMDIASSLFTTVNNDAIRAGTPIIASIEAPLAINSEFGEGVRYIYDPCAMFAEVGEELIGASLDEMTPRQVADGFTNNPTTTFYVPRSTS